MFRSFSEALQCVCGGLVDCILGAFGCAFTKGHFEAVSEYCRGLSAGFRAVKGGFRRLQEVSKVFWGISEVFQGVSEYFSGLT